MQLQPFTAFALSADTLKALGDMGFTEATAIQGEAIPPLLDGRDVLGQSRTGTGKTAAFAVPAVERVDPAVKAVQALILCPTRELCVQVAGEVAKLGKYRRGLSALAVYGGQPYPIQLRGLRDGAQIVIGTPGRVIDHLERGSLRLDAVRLVVLDEADEMLDMGFQEDLEKILGAVPAARQTALFSATMAPAIRRLAAEYLRDPVQIQAGMDSGALSAPAIAQAYLEAPGPLKLEALCRALELAPVKLGMIFRNTRAGVDELVAQLQARGYAADGLHGEHKQAQRDKILARFRAGSLALLVATDVAARGIDVPDVELVVNFDLPRDPEDYVHRIGRTGRAGKAGRALSLAHGRELLRLRMIERFAKARIPRQEIPTLAQVDAARDGAALDKVRLALAAGGLDRYAPLADLLEKEGNAPRDIICALLKLALPAPERDMAADPFAHGPEGRGPRPAPGRWQGRGAEVADAAATRLFLNVGRVQGVLPKDILGALAGETGLPGRTFGAISVQAKHAVVEVPEARADEILERLRTRRLRIKGSPVRARRAAF